MAVPISVQLYTLRDAMTADFQGVINTLAEVGFVGVEPCVGIPGGLDEPTKAKIIREAGLQVSSLHAPAPLGDNQQKVLDAADAYDTKRIILAYYDEQAFSSRDGIKRACDYLNQCNQIATANGLQFGYHNHNAEFQIVDGQSAALHMLAFLEPSVLLEIDTYWAKVGGQDPAAVVSKVGSRAPLLHLKDGPADSRSSPHIALGDGVMDIPAIVKAGAPYTEWLIVELDHCATDMMTAVKKSYDYLVGGGYARGNR